MSRGSAALRDDFARRVETECVDIVDAIRSKDSSAARLTAQIHMDRVRIRIGKAGRDIWLKQGEQLIPPLLFSPPAKNRKDN